MQKKSVKDSFTLMTELIMPNDTNIHGSLFGGRLLQWMDVAAGIAATKHSNSMIVTASVDSVSFNESIKLGDIVTIEAQVSRSFNTSMEIYMEVYKRSYDQEERILCNKAFFTFVALGVNAKPRKVPEAVPETDTDMEIYNGAKRRRDMRLILAGRMKPDDSQELKNLFLPDNAESES